MRLSYPTVSSKTLRHNDTDYLFIANSDNDPVNVEITKFSATGKAIDFFSEQEIDLSQPLPLDGLEIVLLAASD